MGGVVADVARMHCVDAGAQAQGIGQQDEFLPILVAGLADPREEGDARKPFLRRKLDLAGEVMKVPDEAFHDLLEPRVLRDLQLLDDLVGDVELIQVAHRSSLRRGADRSG